MIVYSFLAPGFFIDDLMITVPFFGPGIAPKIIKISHFKTGSRTVKFSIVTVSCP
jgi:hypothetical protein